MTTLTRRLDALEGLQKVSESGCLLFDPGITAEQIDAEILASGKEPPRGGWILIPRKSAIDAADPELLST